MKERQLLIISSLLSIVLLTLHFTSDVLRAKPDNLESGGSTLICTAAFVPLTYVAGNKVLANYLLVPRVPGAEELTVICAALIGASLGFLWFNCHPAQVFMGDTGSLALGGALGVIAVAR